MPADRASCMYCGWNSSWGAPDATAAPAEERFHQGVTLWRLGILALVLIPIAYTQLHTEGPVHPAQWAVALACVLLGPVTFALQLWRRHGGAIELDQHGLVFENGERLDFDSIESITLYTGLPTDLSVRFGAFAIGSSGPARILRFLLCGKLGISLIVGPLMAISYFLVPAVGLLTPFHSRIVLTLRGGRRRVLHDLDEFWTLYLAINSGTRHEPAQLRRVA